MTVQSCAAIQLAGTSFDAPSMDLKAAESLLGIKGLFVPFPCLKP